MKIKFHKIKSEYKREHLSGFYAPLAVFSGALLSGVITAFVNQTVYENKLEAVERKNQIIVAEYQNQAARTHAQLRDSLQQELPIIQERGGYLTGSVDYWIRDIELREGSYIPSDQKYEKYLFVDVSYTAQKTNFLLTYSYEVYRYGFINPDTVTSAEVALLNAGWKYLGYESSAKELAEQESSKRYYDAGRYQFGEDKEVRYVYRAYEKR